MATEYKHLSEPEKNSDRKEADKFLDAVQAGALSVPNDEGASADKEVKVLIEAAKEVCQYPYSPAVELARLISKLRTAGKDYDDAVKAGS